MIAGVTVADTNELSTGRDPKCHLVIRNRNHAAGFESCWMSGFIFMERQFDGPIVRVGRPSATRFFREGFACPKIEIVTLLVCIAQMEALSEIEVQARPAGRGPGFAVPGAESWRSLWGVAGVTLAIAIPPLMRSRRVKLDTIPFFHQADQYTEP